MVAKYAMTEKKGRGQICEEPGGRREEVVLLGCFQERNFFLFLRVSPSYPLFQLTYAWNGRRSLHTAAGLTGTAWACSARFIFFQYVAQTGRVTMARRDRFPPRTHTPSRAAVIG